MKKTLALVLSLAMLLAASTAMAAVEIDYWSVFTGGDGATMQGWSMRSTLLRTKSTSTTPR